MKLYLTKGMSGDRIKMIGDETDQVKKILEYMTFWKQDENTMKNFKVETYSRFIFDKNSIIIDFGDYTYFLEVVDVNEDLKRQFLN